MKRRHLKPDPLGVPRHPLAVFLLLLAVTSGLSQLLGIIVAKTPNTVLPTPIDASWAALLFFGAGCSLFGMFWQGDDIRTGLTLKRVGMFMLGSAALIYAVLLVAVFQVGGLLNAGIILGFGAACFLHYRTIVKRINVIIEASP